MTKVPTDGREALQRKGLGGGTKVRQSPFPHGSLQRLLQNVPEAEVVLNSFLKQPSLAEHCQVLGGIHNSDSQQSNGLIIYISKHG